MENEYKARILGNFRHLELPPIEDLNIADEYEYMDPELIAEIKLGVDFLLKTYLPDLIAVHKNL